MSEKRTRTVNEHGIGMLGLPGERMLDFRVFEESGTVHVEFDTTVSNDRLAGVTTTILQYLGPTEAMAFAKALERCAIRALKNIS